MDDADARELALRYAPYAVVAAIFAFMFWVRTLDAGSAIEPDAVYFTGNDPWYHARIVHYVVRHFPSPPSFDPWSYFPYGTGTHSGFGGLFDQLIALGALVVGAGSPSPHLVNVVVAYAPPVFGAATAIPVYFIARRLTDRWSGLLAPVLLALIGGQFLSRTVVGSADHQSAEAFFGSLAVAGFLYALTVAYAEKPTVADIRDRTWIVLRRPVIAAVVGGLAIASYLMMWPPGVFIVFALGVAVVLQAIRDHLAGRPVEYLAFATTGSMLVAGVFTLAYARSYTFNSTAFSLLQPFVLVAIAAGAVVLYYLSDVLDERGRDRRSYPAAVVALIAAGLVAMAVVFPRGIDLLENLIRRIYSFGLLTSSTSLTVAEIQPASFSDAWSAFGAFFLIATIGFALAVVRLFRRDRPAELVLVVWSLTVLSAYFTSIRFGYYLAVNVALLSGFAIWWIGRHLLSLDAIGEASELETYQIIGVLIIIIAVVPGNVVAMGNQQPVWETADGLSGANRAWHNELDWMRSNTPDPGLEYYGTYEPPADEDFEYPESAYGVMSWWDYGHWITFTAHRIPNANPFQQGQIGASAFLLAQSEERANLILEALPSLDDSDTQITEASNEELRSIIESQSDQEAGEDTRYVVIDDQMAAYSPGKFRPIATWTGPSPSSYASVQEFQVGGQQGGGGQGQTARLLGVNDQYRQTMLARLYFQDANGLSHYRLVHETETQTTFLSVARRTPGGFESTGFVNGRLSGRIFQAIQSNQNLVPYDVRRASRVKTFERVEGARLTGSVDTENRTAVFATLRLRTNTGRNFTYINRVQTDENGDFTMTVPYATDDGVGVEEGGTDSGVRATGSYSLFVGNPIQPTATGEASVPETAVYEGREISVELESPEQGNQSSMARPPELDAGT